MMQPVPPFAALILSLWAGALCAQTSAEAPLPVDGAIAPNGRAVELSWFDAAPPRVGSVTVNRRVLGQTGGQSWQSFAPAQGPVMRVTDDSIRPGVAYEYQVLRTARDIVDVGYWAAGVDLPAVAARGTVYVIVDHTVAPGLDAHLQRFVRDLTGDGWRVLGQRAPRGDGDQPLANLQAAAAIKAWLQGHHAQDPFGTHAVVLVGHVPLPMSGQAAPDGHAAVPHATDLFYAEMDGQWRAGADGLLLENTLPSDAIEMQVGRIDFAGLSAGDPARELTLLRAYFDKNHHWRRGMLGDLRRAYGQSKHLLVERHGLRNIVGAGAVEAGGHHDAGEREPWLWGVDFGNSRGARYADDYANKAVFAINFGSGKQKIERGSNAMTALLAQPWYTVAVGWGGRPAWRLHPMALGASIGAVHRATVNNGVAAAPYRETMDYYPTGNYLWRNPVWVNLLGDPTLRAFPLAPAEQVVATQTPQGVRLTWEASPDPDTTGYRVFRAAPESAEFVPLTDAPQEGLHFLDPSPQPGARYMVRAHGRKDVHAGSFFTYAQGAFAGDGADLAADITLETDMQQTVALPEAFTAPQDGIIHALLEGPPRGALARTETGWTYTPPAGFTGPVVLRFSASDTSRTSQHSLTINVTK